MSQDKAVLDQLFKFFDSFDEAQKNINYFYATVQVERAYIPDEFTLENNQKYVKRVFPRVIANNKLSLEICFINSHTQ